MLVGSAEPLAQVLQKMLLERLERSPSPGVRGALGFLLLAAASEAAWGWCNDQVLTLRELEAMERAVGRRVAALLGLVQEVARADEVPSSEEGEILYAVRGFAPGLSADELRQAIARLPGEEVPEIFPYAEERQGVLACMLAVACADGHLDPREEALVQTVGSRLQIPPERVASLLEEARRGIPPGAPPTSAT
ncbi:MAG TPA: TerB family tellurite resistance protein [Candidatus Nitrosotenuis sp.]|nr:TerB family tellurite resistance protein [Candidatus Nitrosotenuis sp.]